MLKIGLKWSSLDASLLNKQILYLRMHLTNGVAQAHLYYYNHNSFGLTSIYMQHMHLIYYFEIWTKYLKI